MVSGIDLSGVIEKGGDTNHVGLPEATGFAERSNGLLYIQRLFSYHLRTDGLYLDTLKTESPD